MRRSIKRVVALMALGLAACIPVEEAPAMLITVQVDGRSLTYTEEEPLTVQQFLDAIEIERGELDRVNPPLFSQISDLMQITVVRVSIEEYCEDEEKPFQIETRFSETVAAGTEVVAETGRSGRIQNCYRVEIADGVRGQPQRVSGPNVIEEAVNRIVYVAPPNTLDPVQISGTIAYISDGDAWVMRASSDARRRVTTTGDLDGRVFSLSENGQRLIFTRTSAEVEGFNNRLWLIPDVLASEPQRLELRPANLLHAAWIPGRANQISYSQAEPRPSPPGWRAFNDLWVMTIEPDTGAEIRLEPIIENDTGGGGPFNWWGREYAWSPDGQQVAYVHADEVGVLDTQTGELRPLLNFSELAVIADWSWRTTVSWSPDARTLITTTHGAPYRDEDPRRSPVFNITAASVDGGMQATLLELAGIWSLPKFSPFVPTDSVFPKGYLAYMKARQPLESLSNQAEYDLVVADRDGSNPRRIFPAEDSRAGILSREYTWSPDGRELLVVYQGNLQLIDVETGLARQLTLDGNVSRPVLWAR